MTMPFHDRVRQQTEAIWEAIYTQPFLQELGQGLLSHAAFTFFIRQDYLYLQEFGRVLCLGGAQADSLDTLAMFAEHAATVVQVERALHSQFAMQLGLSLADLDSTPMAPTTQAYTRHLFTVGHTGTLGEIVAAVLPCYWIYWEVGQRLNRQLPADPMYAAWIQAYASPAFGTHVGQQLALIDRLAPLASEAERQRMAEHFTQSCRYEYLFWEQAYRQTTWPV
ncbi:MAG: thiaminase II [Candidatus Tectimicrobiota bacterium]